MSNKGNCLTKLPGSRALSVHKSRLLGSTAVMLCAAAFALPAAANDLIINGITIANNSPAFILGLPGLTDTTVVNVNTQNITGPAIDTIRVAAFQGATTLTVDAGKSVSGRQSPGPISLRRQGPLPAPSTATSRRR